MVNLTLKQLVYLSTFSDVGSIKEAARVLRVSDNQVRKTLHYINEKLNNRLLIMYNGDGLPAKLTEAGKEAAVKAKQIIEIANEIILPNATPTGTYQGKLF